jgi:hypothetical protein
MPLPSCPAVSRRAAFAALKARLDTAAIAAPRPALDAVLPLALPALDRLLGGGFPRGTLVALEGNAGRWSIAVRLAAAVTARAAAAIVDDGALYPPDLVRSGVRLDRLLIVPAESALAIARAADILLHARACRLVVMPAPQLRAQVWARLAGLAHRTGAVLVAVAPPSGSHAGALIASAGIRLHCTRERLIVVGARGPWCMFAGYDVRADVRKSRSSPGGRARIRAGEGLDAGKLHGRLVTCEVPADAAVR